jgi:hypothetical protein
MKSLTLKRDPTSEIHSQTTRSERVVVSAILVLEMMPGVNLPLLSQSHRCCCHPILATAATAAAAATAVSASPVSSLVLSYPCLVLALVEIV